MAERNLGIPSALNWLYVNSLNHQTDLVFWQETKYKPNQPLNPSDPGDSAMIPKWWAVRARIVRALSPRDLIRIEAVERASNAYQQGTPHILYTAGTAATGVGHFDTAAFPDGAQLENYLTQHLPGVSYYAIFNANDPRWPQPTYETYPRAERASPNVSGEVPRGSYRSGWPRSESVIRYEGLTLRPLTADVLARQPELDPARRDAGAAGRAWIDLQGNRQPARLIRDVWQPGDALYYWDGPWGTLSGSNGIAVVRNGRVVEAFTVWVS